MTDGGTCANERPVTNASAANKSGPPYSPWANTLGRRTCEGPGEDQCTAQVRISALATGEAQAMPIYPSGMPAHGFCYDILIHIIAHYRPSNNRQK